MAKGWGKVEQATAAAQEARERAEQNGKPQLYTSHVDPAKGGSPVVVRILEQGTDVNVYQQHEYSVPNPKGGRPFNRRFTCLREDPWNLPECPGCAAGLKLKTRGVYNVIQRNRAVLRKDKDGRALKVNDQYIVDGHADQVVIWDVPSTTAEVLRQKDGSYHGLMSRDLILTLSGNTFQPWSIEPADIDSGMTPMTEADQALAAQKHNLDEFMKPPTVEAARQIVARYGANSGASPNATNIPSTPPQGNAGQAGSAGGFLGGVAPQQGGVPTGAFDAAQQ